MSEFTTALLLCVLETAWLPRLFSVRTVNTNTLLFVDITVDFHASHPAITRYSCKWVGGCAVHLFLICANCLLICPTGFSSHHPSSLTCRMHVSLSAHSCLDVSFSSFTQTDIFGLFRDSRLGDTLFVKLPSCYSHIDKMRTYTEK